MVLGRASSAQNKIVRLASRPQGGSLSFQWTYETAPRPERFVLGRTVECPFLVGLRFGDSRFWNRVYGPDP